MFIYFINPANNHGNALPKLINFGNYRANEIWIERNLIYVVLFQKLKACRNNEMLKINVHPTPIQSHLCITLYVANINSWENSPNFSRKENQK